MVGIGSAWPPSAPPARAPTAIRCRSSRRERPSIAMTRGGTGLGLVPPFSSRKAASSAKDAKGREEENRHEQFARTLKANGSSGYKPEAHCECAAGLQPAVLFSDWDERGPCPGAACLSVASEVDRSSGCKPEAHLRSLRVAPAERVQEEGRGGIVQPGGWTESEVEHLDAPVVSARDGSAETKAATAIGERRG